MPHPGRGLKPDTKTRIPHPMAIIRLLRIQKELLIPRTHRLRSRSTNQHRRTRSPINPVPMQIALRIKIHLRQPTGPALHMATQSRVTQRSQNARLTAQRRVDAAVIVQQDRYHRAGTLLLHALEHGSHSPGSTRRSGFRMR
jgi:hypothetical protein